MDTTQKVYWRQFLTRHIHLVLVAAATVAAAGPVAAPPYGSHATRPLGKDEQVAAAAAASRYRLVGVLEGALHCRGGPGVNLYLIHGKSP